MYSRWNRRYWDIVKRRNVDEKMTFIDLLRDFPKSFDFVINEFIISKRHVPSLDFPSIRPTYIYSRG